MSHWSSRATRRAYESALGELRGEVERVATLVNDLFTLARADADERAFTSTRVQLDEIVLEAVTTAGWIAARRGIKLTVVESEEAIIDGDAALLHQLTLILLDNAIKFSRDSGVVTISVSVGWRCGDVESRGQWRRDRGGRHPARLRAILPVGIRARIDSPALGSGSRSVSGSPTCTARKSSSSRYAKEARALPYALLSPRERRANAAGVATRARGARRV